MSKEEIEKFHDEQPTSYVTFMSTYFNPTCVRSIVIQSILRRRANDPKCVSD